MKKVDFLFLIEHEDREGSVVSELARKLKSSGYVVLAISIPFGSYYIEKIQPKVVVVPYALSDDSWPLLLFKSAKFKKTKIVSLNWEQLLSKANFAFKKPKGEMVKEACYHLAWHDDFKCFLKESGVVDGNINVIGNPLYDLLKDKVEFFDQTPVRDNFNIGNSKVIFFPMNYGWAFMNDSQVMKKIKAGYNPEHAWEYREYSRKCFKNFVLFITELSKIKPDIFLVVRPHPSIPVEYYTNEIKKLVGVVPSNLLVTKELSITEWIALADLVVSSWSTSVWDAVSVGKKGALFTPFPRPEWLETYWNNLVCNFTDISDFIEMSIEADEKVNCRNKSIPAISRWLESILLFEEVDKEIKPVPLKSYVYHSRAFLRTLSMRFLGGKLVSKGIRRDYFSPRWY